MYQFGLDATRRVVLLLFVNENIQIYMALELSISSSVGIFCNLCFCFAFGTSVYVCPADQLLFFLTTRDVSTMIGEEGKHVGASRGWPFFVCFRTELCSGVADLIWLPFFFFPKSPEQRKMVC